jgi:preprotein translocase subunit SecF
MFVVKYRKIFYTFSAVLVVASLLSLCVWGLNLGIDFKGGTLVEIDYPASSFPAGRPNQSVISGELASLSATVPNLDSSIQPSGTTGYILRLRALSQPEKIDLESALNINTSAIPVTASTTLASTTVAASTGVQETSFESIGPVLGAQAARAALLSIVFVIIAIVLFIAYAFRRVSLPVSSWKYGMVAIIDLLHNIIIPTGVFSVLGHFLGYQVDTLFVTALLVVLGFSVHDTIVVFDRVRENLRISGTKKPFDEIVGMSINQTFTRSVNTSLTTLIALFALYFVGGAGTQNFSLVLIIGIAAGTYASIFLGSPLLVTIQKMQANKIAKNKAGKK